MPASILTMPEATRAAQMYAQGWSEPEIAGALGRSRKSIHTGLRQLGLKTRTPAEGLRLFHRRHALKYLEQA